MRLPKSLRMLVIGGTGFVGSHYVRAAVARGHQVTVYDNLFLVVAEHTTNSLLTVRRDLATVQPLAGLPLPAGGFSDGEGGSIRFHFTAPVALFADAIGLAFVGDTEKHALRQAIIGTWRLNNHRRSR